MNTSIPSKKNNFDLLRLLLSSIVFCSHAAGLSKLPELSNLQYLMIVDPVSIFFIISGFLISMSYDRSTSIKSYIYKRARRILPAYIAVVIGCVIGGIFLTKLPLSSYFSPHLFKYLLANLTFLNFLEPSLPGVFNGDIVNGSLWTIKSEVMFYACLPVFIYYLRRTNKIVIFAVTYILSIIYFETFTYLAISQDKDIFELLSLQLPGKFCYFIGGILIYFYFDNFKRNSTLYLILGIIGWLVAKHFSFFPLYPLSLSAITIYFCLCCKYLGNWGKYGDFSYGIYIWNYPVIQTFINLGVAKFNPWLFLFSSAGLVFFMAFISWHYIEKPMLKTNNHYFKVTTSEK